MDEERERELSELLGDDPDLEWSHDEHDLDGEFHPPQSDFAELEDHEGQQDTLGGGMLSFGDLD